MKFSWRGVLKGFKDAVLGSAIVIDGLNTGNMKQVGVGSIVAFLGVLANALAKDAVANK